MPAKKSAPKAAVKKTKAAVKPVTKKGATAVKPALKKVTKPVAKMSKATKPVAKKVVKTIKSTKKAVPALKIAKPAKKVIEHASKVAARPLAKTGAKLKLVIKPLAKKRATQVKTVKLVQPPSVKKASAPKTVSKKTVRRAATAKKVLVTTPVLKTTSEPHYTKQESKMGLIIMGIAILAIAFANITALRYFAKNPQQCPTPTTSTGVVNAQVLTSDQALVAASPVASASPALAAVNRSQSGQTVTVTVQKVDNFWKIAQRACGNGKYGEELRRQAGYTNRSIQPGDVFQVQCP